MPKARFEALFRAFVKDFGGEVLPEGRQRSADYFFRPYNVVAELKCLVVDQTLDTLKKLGALIDQRRAALPPQPGPADILRLFECSETFRQGWGKVLLAPIENLIRDANRQIRQRRNTSVFLPPTELFCCSTRAIRYTPTAYSISCGLLVR